MKNYFFQWVSFTFVIVVGLLFYVHCCESSELPRKPILQALTEYIEDYLEIYPKRAEEAIVLLPDLISICKQYKVPPLLMAKTISDESSWISTAYNSRKGERGLSQVHGVAAYGQDLITSKGQIRAGAMWLGRALKRCNGDIQGAIVGYMSGLKCSANVKDARRRYRGYLKLKKQYCPSGCC